MYPAARGLVWGVALGVALWLALALLVIAC